MVFRGSFHTYAPTRCLFGGFAQGGVLPNGVFHGDKYHGIESAKNHLQITQKFHKWSCNSTYTEGVK